MSDETQEIKIELDPRGPFTLNEIIEIESMCDELVFDRSGRFMRAVAFVTGKRTNPNLSLSDVGQLEVRSDG